MRIAGSVALFTILLSGIAAAQHERPSTRALKIEPAPTIDGNVRTDPAWRSVPPATQFVQKNPVEGNPASERTEVRLVYTSTALYVGVICFDRSPDGIIISGTRRDSSLDNSDSFRIILDTYQDGQNGFVFGTNPGGLEYDGQVTSEGRGGGGGGGPQGGSGGGLNLNWDGVWRVRTLVDEQGWSAEFEIPFRTLRYPDKAVQSWGLNFERGIRRRNEIAYWSPLPRQFDISRLSLAGVLEDLEVPAQRNFKVIPYVVGEARDESHRPKTRIRGEPGMDAKYSLTPSLTLDATWNTDFAQVEVDEQQINLDRFNLFFPEKRPFFLENAGLFAVGSPGEAEVFFSRQIGIGADGRAIPIAGGARLSGQAGRGLNVGFLNMQTESVGGVIAANNFSVARLRQDLPNRSSVGVIAVNRQGTGRLAADNDYNRSFAVDGRWGIGRSGLLSGFAAMTVSPERSGDEHAFQVSAARETQALELRATYTEVGEHFRPDVGFLSRRGGFRKPDLLVFTRLRPRSFMRLQEVRPHTSYRGFWKPDGFHESGQWHVDSHWEFKSGDEVHTGINFTREGVRQAFEIAGVRIPAGTYDHKELQLVGFTSEARRLTFSWRATIGGFFGGDRVALAPGVTFRFSDAFSTELTWSRNDVELPSGSFTTNLGRARLSYSFTPRTFLQGLVQYNDAADLWSANLRFGWLQEANTGLFIVYNDTQHLDDDLRPAGAVTGRSLTVKISRMIDVLR